MTRRIERALPRTSELTPAEARVVVGAFILLIGLLAITAANAVFGIGGHAATITILNWVTSAIYVLVALIIAIRAIRIETRRVGWTLLTMPAMRTS